MYRCAEHLCVPRASILRPALPTPDPTVYHNRHDGLYVFPAGAFFPRHTAVSIPYKGPRLGLLITLSYLPCMGRPLAEIAGLPVIGVLTTGEARGVHLVRVENLWTHSKIVSNSNRHHF